MQATDGHGAQKPDEPEHNDVLGRKKRVISANVALGRKAATTTWISGGSSPHSRVLRYWWVSCVGFVREHGSGSYLCSVSYSCVGSDRGRYWG